jgi:hypothetical protein
MSTAAALPGTPFNPTQISGCVLWLDANDKATMTFNGSAITQWNDKSSVGNYVFQSTVGNAPTLGTSQNGLNTVYFATTNQQLVSSQNNATSGNSSRTVIILFWCPTLTSAYYTVTGTESSASPAPAWGHCKNANSDVDYPFTYGGSPDTYSFVYSTPNPLLTYSQYDSTSSTLSGYYATVGATGGTTTVGNFITKSATFNTTSGVWYLGRRQQAATGSVTSHLMEMIQYNTPISTSQRQQIEGYLAQKWALKSNLPQDHPGQKGIIYPTGTLQRNPGPIQYYLNFTPLQISGCQLWLDAADATKFTFSSGSNISGWLDKSPSANNLTTASGTPVYTTDGALSVVNIPSGAVLQTTANLVITTSSAFFVVAKLTSAATGYPMLITLIDNNSGDYSIRYSGSVVNFGNSDDIGNLNYYTNGATNANASFLNQYVIIDTTTATRAATSRVAVSGTFSGRYFIGNVLEVIIYPGGVNSTQRSQLQSYLAAKWNLVPQIPTSHLHFTRPAGMPVFTPSLQIQAIPLSRYVFNYVSNFSLTNFTVGGTFTPVISSGTLQLANNGGSQGNYAWHIQKQSITNFQTTFIMNFQSTNADGSAFVIQNSSSTAVGSVGGGLAYQGIGTSLAITLKSYNGSAGQFSTEVVTGGSAPTLTGASGVLNTSLGLTAGGTWNLLVNVKYNGTNLNYTITNTANSNSYTSNAPYNIPSLVGANTAYVGFTTGTGGLAEYCYLNSWNYATLNLPA